MAVVPRLATILRAIHAQVRRVRMNEHVVAATGNRAGVDTRPGASTRPVVPGSALIIAGKGRAPGPAIADQYQLPVGTAIKNNLAPPAINIRHVRLKHRLDWFFGAGE